MAFSELYNLPEGKLLQPYFSEGVRSQLSATFPEWQYVEMQKVHDGASRHIKFEFLNGYGPASIQMRNPNGSTAFPTKQAINLAENIAELKTIEVTLSVGLEPRRYSAVSGTSYASADVLVMESKLKALKRHRSKQFYADGTGVMGQIGATAQTVASGLVSFTLSTANTARGHIGFFEKDDIMILRAAAGSASAFDSSLGTEPIFWQVVSRSHATNVVVMQPLDTNRANTAAITSITTSAASGEVFYRCEQPTIPDLTGTIADYGTITEEIAGLESLTANDGRVCHGVTMQGFGGGSRFDAGAVQLTGAHIESAMSDAEIAAGEGQYRYRQMLMSHKARTNLVEDRQASTYFINIKDDTLGVNKIKYQYRDNTVEALPREYCPKTRLYVLPEGAEEKEKVLELYSSDVIPVQDDKGGFWRLEPSSSGGFSRSWIAYMSGRYVLVNKHPAAIAVCHNFTLS